VTFEEYMDIHEYHNIQTRMLGADSFPYRNITVTKELYDKAVAALDSLFFVGVQEEFEISAKVRECNHRALACMEGGSFSESISIEHIAMPCKRSLSPSFFHALSRSCCGSSA
jgi:hypothetical protein